MNFWKKFKKPFFCLAPMADVTDPAFRRIIAKYSADARPTEQSFGRVFWTEFVSADGLASAGREVLKINLKFTKKEKPIVAQLFSSHPEKMRQASKLCAELGFDGIDINMGCPDRSIEKQGCGAAMIKTPEIAGQIIQAVKDGIKDANKNIPVSVKTRVGYNKENIDEWIPFLLSQNIEALIVHARTRKDMSKVPANWDYIKRVVMIRDKMKVKTKIIGNGDVASIEDGKKKIKENGCDGVMIGRGIFGNPWLFSGKVPSVKQKLKVMVEHAKLFEKLLGGHKNFYVMKKHFKAYVNGFTGAKELRVKLMETNSTKEVEGIVNKFLKNH